MPATRPEQELGRLTIAADLAVGWLCRECLDYLWRKRNLALREARKAEKRAAKEYETQESDLALVQLRETFTTGEIRTETL